jgi:peptidyl-prolyl cis-trans isomerase SurA
MESHGAENAPVPLHRARGTVWQPRGVQIRRLTAATAAGLALAGLAACRTAPNVAAYVGDSQVTVAELEAAVEERLEDPAVAEAHSADPEAYERTVLTQLVENEVHAVAAERYGVEVSDAQVNDRIEVLLGGEDPEEVFAGLASQGVSREDVFDSVWQQMIRLEIAEEEGLADALSEEALRERFEGSRSPSTEIEFGYMTVPDERAADQVVAALEADPDRYGELAERFAGSFTLPEPVTRPLGEIPAPLAEQAAEAEEGTAYAVPVEETGGIVVVLVTDVPSFDDERAQLEQEAGGEVEAAVRPVVDDVREELDIQVNPQYGELEDGQVEQPGRDFIDIVTEG